MLLQQARVAGDSQDVFLGEVVLSEDASRQVGPVPQREVARGDAPVGLRQAHLRVVEHDVEERP